MDRLATTIEASQCTCCSGKLKQQIKAVFDLDEHMAESGELQTENVHRQYDESSSPDSPLSDDNKKQVVAKNEHVQANSGE